MIDGSTIDTRNPTDIHNLTDTELYRQCLLFGRRALEARRRFMGLLPEVYRRGLFKKKGFESIYEFAAKLAGVSHDHVNRILQLEKKYEDKPVLRAALIGGEVSVNKLVRIASVATIENQEMLLDRAQNLSKAALEIYVRDYKNADGLNKPGKAVPGHRLEEKKNSGQSGQYDSGSDFEIINCMSPVLKMKIKELMDKKIDVNQLFLDFLADREKKIGAELEALGEEQRQIQKEKNLIGMPTSRHVPVKIRKIIEAKYGNVCAVEGCGRPAAALHHENRFASNKLHDPRKMKPLCRAHHELEHMDEQKYRAYRQSIFAYSGSS